MISWLLLLVSLVGGLLVWNVYRPLAATRRAGALSFFTGWLTAELGIHHIAWQAVFTLGFIVAGALEGAPGRLGLAIALLSWLALGLHYLRGFDVQGVMDGALAEGLGRDFEARMAPELRATLPREIEWGPILAPFPIRHPRAERIRNIRYGRANAIDLSLDIYRPLGREGAGPSPSLLYVHGGGWVIGTKDNQGLPLCYRLAARGWTCFNANYRLSPHATFPDHLVDLKRAVAWIREHGPSYGADPQLLVVAGGSAGGHLAALLALTGNEPAYQPGFEDADTAVQGCIPFYGVYDFTNQHEVWNHELLRPMLERHVMKATLEEDPEAFARASPLRCVHRDAPPFFVIHGQDDSLVPVGEARTFAEVLRQTSSASVCYAEIPGAQHAFEIFPSLRSQLVSHGVERWLAALEGEARSGDRAEDGADGLEERAERQSA